MAVAVCRVDDLSNGYGGATVILAIPDAHKRELIVLNAGCGPLAYENACPHMGIPLDWDSRRMSSRAGEYLRCSGHGAIFRASDGMCLVGPCEGDRLRAVPLLTHDGVIYIDDMQVRNVDR